MDGSATGRVHSFCAATCTWSLDALPSLLQARYQHSSCALGTGLYVICGIGEHSQLLSSIETISLQPYGAKKQWRELHFDALTPRANPSVCIAEPSFIQIFGGSTSVLPDGSAGKLLGDMVEVDTESESAMRKEAARR